MDWTNILGYILTGGGVLGLWEGIKWVYTRRDEKRGIQLENDHKSVDAANDTTNVALSALQSIEEERNELAARNRELRDQLDTLRSERAVGTMLLCRNIDCPLRSPEYLRGKQWFDSFDTNSVEEIADRRKIEEIAAEKGYTLIKNMLKREEE